MTYKNLSFQNISQYFVNFFAKGHPRSLETKKNIIFSLIIKIFSIAISIVLVPLTINYVNPSRYGIWLTLSSIVGWLTFFDIGFGNGLRNKFAQALAEKKEELARIYVSTTYVILSMIIGVVIFLFFVVNPFINWARVLNSPPEMEKELGILAIIVFVFFCLRFIFQLLGTVLTASQQPAKTSLLELIGSSLSLAIIFVLTKTTSGNLVYLGAALSFTPVFVMILASFWFYSGKFRKFAPSFKYVHFKYARDLMSLGLKFFIIQICALILFDTNNFIIIHLFGASDVTTYNVSFKLFSVVTMVFTIIVTPLWSAFTDAYAQNDFEWIRTTISTMKKIWLALSILSIVLLAFSPWIFKLWLGNKVTVPFSLSVAMASYVIVYIWQTFHVFFLNGIGKIQLQLYLVIFSSLVNIPLAIFLGRHFGLVGITLTSTMLFTFMGIIFSIQAAKIINKTATKIWNK
jgi:O-antigen/teichoic acid export membrane protein